LFSGIPFYQTVEALDIVVLSVLERLVAPGAGIETPLSIPVPPSSRIRLAHPTDPTSTA
jgi:hypothetical protein